MFCIFDAKVLQISKTTKHFAKYFFVKNWKQLGKPSPKSGERHPDHGKPSPQTGTRNPDHGKSSSKSGARNPDHGKPSPKSEAWFYCPRKTITPKLGQEILTTEKLHPILGQGILTTEKLHPILGQGIPPSAKVTYSLTHLLTMYFNIFWFLKRKYLSLYYIFIYNIMIL